MQYPINEMFQTLQGEGYFTGVPAIFIRLQGCPVGCAWCDTKHTWDKFEDREVSPYSILAKTKESDKWGATSSEDLLAVIGRQKYTARHWWSRLLRKNAHDALEADQEAIRSILSEDPQPTPLAGQRMRVNLAHNTLYNSLNQTMQEPMFNRHYLVGKRKPTAVCSH
ncbi:7-carboxy-7-deazaguanine synthase [Escherichia coli]|uniref:7-carboxy-7-deazaguanine synthase n=1 Tax=Escherichia coli TaxID=562 RepID=A0A3P5DJ32_ECOLX|nr:hypothetical protein FJMB80155_42790 [Escherichia coli]GHK78629.1 hypothetical protein ECZU13_44940 [Escherichia coli]GHK79280.1 hypothetical protein ECZU15_02120 [Escherichia coli]VCY81515.1 7-carboxy-7-deazaguanine synthase [Escherichia coli]